MLKPLTLLTAIALFAPPPPTTTKVRVRTGKRTRTTLHLGAKCDAKKAKKVLNREVKENRRLLKGLRGSVHASMTAAEVASFERDLAKILAEGRHRVRGGAGVIRFEGVDIPFGRAPREGESRDTDRGRTTVTGLPRGGVSFARTSTKRSGVKDILEVTFNPDGSSKMTRSLIFGDVEVTEESEHDKDGRETNSFGTVKNNSAPLHSGGIGPSGPPSKQQSTGGGNDTSESDQSSGGGGGDDNAEPTPSPPEKDNDDQEKQNSNPPTMTSDDHFVAPPMDLSDEMLAKMINWNRLGAAVTQPAPHRDGEGEPDERHAGGRMGPCGQLDDDDFDPNPKYLRPNKQGWVTDPRPFLGRGRKR